MPESTDTLRVLIVCQNDLAGASEKQALCFGMELAHNGHHVLLSLHGDPASAQSEGAVDVENLQVHFHEFRGRTLRRRDLTAARDFAPTLIHAFNARVPIATAARAYARATAAPVFVHWEDDEFGILERVNTRSLVRRLASRARRIACVVYPPAGPMVTAPTLRWAQNAAGHDALTAALADWVRDQLRRPCQVVMPIVQHVHEPPAAPSDRLKDLRGRQVLMLTGEVHGGSITDLVLALRATAVLREKGHDVVLVHAGRVGARFDVDTLVREAGLTPEDARFLGYLPFAAIPPLLREADVLLQPGAPSRFNRLRLPSKMQAYLASGVPTVTFAIGFAEVLADGAEVLKLQTAEVDELAGAVAAIITDPLLREHLGKRGRSAAQRLFDPATNGAVLVDHFRAGLNTATSRSPTARRPDTPSSPPDACTDTAVG